MKKTELPSGKTEIQLSETGNQNLPATFEKCSTLEVKQSLKFAMVTAGLGTKNLPSEIEKQVLVTFVTRNYPDYTPAEIAWVFELAMARKIPVDDVKCYGNFSCEYIGRILSAYEQWSGEGGNNCSYSISVDRYYKDFLKGKNEFYPIQLYQTLVNNQMIARRGKLRMMKVQELIKAFFTHRKDNSFEHAGTDERGYLI